MYTVKTKKFMEIALDEMFRRVGFSGFDANFVQQDAWYTLRSWSPSEEQSYRMWFIEKGRKYLRLSKKVLEREYSYFNLMFGWKISMC